MKKTLLTLVAISFCLGAKAQLTGITPNQGFPGQQNLNTTISSAGLFLQSSSPSGNLYQIYLDNGAYQVYLFDYNIFTWPPPATVINADTVYVTDTDIPIGAPLGSYDLKVTIGDIFDPTFNQQFFTLPAAFTMGNPDGNVTGTVYFDTNQNGIQDGGELGVANQTISINPGNLIVTTDVNGDYTWPLFNGTYTAQYIKAANNNYSLISDSIITFIISSANSTGNDFGLENAITNIAINYAQIGTSVLPIITSDSLFTTQPTQVYLSKTTSPFNSIAATTNTILNVTQLSSLFTFPLTTSLTGVYDLYVAVNGVSYKMGSAFTIILFSNGITGTVYFDANGNGIKDGGELPVSNGNVELTPGNLLGLSDNSGMYGFGTANGNYTVTYLPKNYEIVTSVTSYNVTVNNNIAGGNDFGVQIDPAFDSLSLMVSHWLLRCNWNTWITIQVKNSGYGPENGRVYFLKDPLMSYTSAVPPADYVSGDTAYWNFTNLLPGQTLLITPTYLAPGAGTVVNFHIIAAILDAGNNIVFTNQQDFNCTVSCSYDPNDKRANPPGVQVPNYTLFAEDLYYTIRFQNTGNDTAFKVVILDTLDSNLDLSTFAFVTSTHPVITELNPANGALKFTFNNILLPDSNVNEPASNGEVTYRVKTQTGLPANTVINNTAYIIFDLNVPVVTNTTLNTMVYVIPVGVNEITNTGTGDVIYPNPFDQSAWLVFENRDHEKFDLVITDIRGRNVFEKEISSDRFLIEKGSIGIGMYFYRLSNKDCTINFSGKFVAR